MQVVDAFENAKCFLSGLSILDDYEGNGHHIIHALRRSFPSFAQRAQWAQMWRIIAEKELCIVLFAFEDASRLGSTAEAAIAVGASRLRSTAEAAIAAGAKRRLVELGMKYLRRIEIGMKPTQAREDSTGSDPDLLLATEFLRPLVFS